jgi:uncharacterized protein
LFSGACEPDWFLSVLPVQLKTIQEVITLTVFSVFSVVYLKQELRWNYIVGFALICAAVWVIFRKW